MKRRIGSLLLSSLLVLVVVLSLLSGCKPADLATAGTADDLASAPAAAQPAPPVAETGAVAALEGTLESIYERVNPSVVSIQVSQKQEVTSELPFGGWPFFDNSTPQQPQEQYRQGSGSGFVWDTQGHIVTNNHVVEGADRIRVTFADGTTVTGEVVGTDPDSDLAVVKVDVPAGQLQPVQLADSTQVKVGSLAVAIGQPFGLENTMTVGFVSAIGRSLPTGSETADGPSYTIPDVIQTDAPINPGNSGGVLLDAEGRVIGVTSAIVSPVQASAGIGYAVPSAIVQKVVPALIEKGSYAHPYLGISGMTLDPDVASAMGLDEGQRGALVVEVVPGEAADKAGLRGSDQQVTVEGQDLPSGGDVIVAIDDQTVKTFDDLVSYLVRSTQAGQKVTLTILRDGKEQKVAVTLGERAGEESQTQPVAERQTAGGAWLGVAGVTLSPELARAAGLPEGAKGVLLQQVTAGGPADKAELQGSYKPVTVGGRRVLVGGDVIVAWDEQAVTGMEDLQAFVSRASAGDEVTLAVLRDGEQITVKVTLETLPASE